jgi:cytochrome c oxidase subunit 2
VEALWTIVPGIMLFSLAVYQYGAWTQIKIDLPPEADSVVLAVAGQQFEWYATYPGPDGSLDMDDAAAFPSAFCPDADQDTDDDVDGPANTIHVPVNRTVIVYLTACDVLHSFFVPVLRLKQDAVPGTTIRLWFEATQTGEFEIVCAELCGLGHYRMRGLLTVEDEAAFQAWLAELAAR